MASVLKRKRYPPDDSQSLKRSKSVKEHKHKIIDGSSITFNSTEELAQVNRKSKKIDNDAESPAGSLDPQEVPGKEKEINASTLCQSKKFVECWYLSPSIGGRLIRSDPVFTADEKFLIVSTLTTVQVIGTADSLLTRSIKLRIDSSCKVSNHILTHCLSPSKPNILWVACSDGSIFSLDWTTGAGTDSSWTISSTGCLQMNVASMESLGRKRDVIFTIERRTEGGFRITANELASSNCSFSTSTRTIYTCKEPIQLLKAANDGSVLVGASGCRILIGRLRSTEFDTVDKIKYEFRTLESKDYITCLDTKISKRSESKIDAKNKTNGIPTVDLVVGNVKGVIFFHNDIARKIFSQSQNGIASSTVGLVPSKLHWHRQNVNSVRWSLDGNYIISGGTETVLVLWQLDTGKREFLPHLSSVIENIIVSPSGSAYAIQLSDNSVMVLSTVDLLPKMNISGIQASILQSPKCIATSVLKVEGKTWPKPLIQRTPATVNPNLPSHILLAVGPNQEVRPTKPLITSNPLLQTFDLTTCKSISNQALTRTNVTNVNATSTANCIVEPRVLHLKLSSNGLWLATVDEWIPPTRDYEHLQHSEKDNYLELIRRREVFLKFWQWNINTSTWQLVSRIDMPHSFSESSRESGQILDLVADPSSSKFATIGSDRTVKTWCPKSRKRNGVLVRGSSNEILKSWTCMNTTSLGKFDLVDLDKISLKIPVTGCVSFSEDGSVLAAAIGGHDSLLHLIDSHSGTIRVSHARLVQKEIFGLEFLGKDLIVLSNKLQSFDVVSEEPKHVFKLRSSIADLSTDQKREMIHLAIDSKSKTFAVALPILSSGTEKLIGAKSELVIFDQNTDTPQFRKIFPSLITALLPAIGSEGYHALDATAEICSILRKGSQVFASLAQYTSDIRPDITSDEPSQITDVDLEDDNNENEMDQVRQISEPMIVGIEEEESDGYDNNDEFPVVTQHQLAEILDVGPAFALPPVEELFYQVASLFTTKPLAQMAQ